MGGPYGKFTSPVYEGEVILYPPPKLSGEFLMEPQTYSANFNLIAISPKKFFSLAIQLIRMEITYTN